MKSINEIEKELHRILEFINSYVHLDEKIVIPVSGGLDSDVVARLCHKAVGPDRIKLFTVHQQHMEEKYLVNTRKLATDLGVKLVEFELGTLNTEWINRLHAADPSESFNPNSLLDPARANCSLRTAIFSSYQDKGYIVACNSNRSEIELGFFMPFGDNLGHFKPIAHLYKSEVRILAELVSTRPEVIKQSPSAGFWEGEEDMEDLAYWLYNCGPISGSKVFTEEDDTKVLAIKEALSQIKVDECLERIHMGHDSTTISQKIELPESIVEGIRITVTAAKHSKNRLLLQMLTR